MKKALLIIETVICFLVAQNIFARAGGGGGHSSSHSSSSHSSSSHSSSSHSSSNFSNHMGSNGGVYTTIPTYIVLLIVGGILLFVALVLYLVAKRLKKNKEQNQTNISQ
jgi:hypothetical protein